MPGTLGSQITIMREWHYLLSPTQTSNRLPSKFSNEEIETSNSEAYVFQKNLCLLEVVSENRVQTKCVTCLMCQKPAKGKGL